ncbi:MAG: hypothetical protein RID23_13210 [Roseovarius sp.]
MTPTEFVARLAEIMEVQQTELATVDRALAKKGLRRLARGRSRPDINLMEAIQIVCAWAGVKNLTDAAEELQRQRNFQVSTDGLTEETECKYMEAFGTSLKEISGQSFPDVVRLAACQLGEGKYPLQELWISIEKGGSVDLGYKRDDPNIRLLFYNLSTPEFFQPRKNVTINVVIRGPVLKWIYDVTEGA